MKVLLLLFSVEEPAGPNTFQLFPAQSYNHWTEDFIWSFEKTLPSFARLLPIMSLIKYVKLENCKNPVECQCYQT